MIIRNLTYLFVAGALIIAIVSTFQQTQPALFWIDVFAPDPGDKYSVNVVLLLTLLTCLLPVLMVLIPYNLIRKYMDNQAIKKVTPDQTGIWISRKKELYNALVDIPLFINDKEVSSLYSGARKFFPLLPGKVNIVAGKKKLISQEFNYDLQKSEQLKLEVNMVSDNGIFTRPALRQVL